MLNKDVSPGGQRTAVIIMTVSTFIVSTTSLANVSSSAITHGMVASIAVRMAVKVSAVAVDTVAAAVGTANLAAIVAGRRAGQGTIVIMTGGAGVMLLVAGR